MESKPLVKTLLIQISNREVVLAPTLTIPIQRTNFPIAYCQLSDYKPIYWEAEITDYEEKTACLKLSIINYSASFDGRFDKQKPRRKIEQLEFAKFDWRSLEAHLMHYKIAHLEPFIERNVLNFNYNSTTKRDVNFIEPIIPVDSEFSKELIAQKTKIIEFEKQWRINFNNAFFYNGYLKFTKSIPEVKSGFEVKIYNDNLLQEFDLIKPYIAKKLGNTFLVKAKLKIKDKELIALEATSEDINQINENLLEQIRQQRIYGLKRAIKKPEVDQSLFTSDELFDLSSDGKGNVFRDEELDVMELFSNLESVRNRKQLLYLAGQLQNSKTKLRFTLHPHFGFVFHILGKTHHHFVWELLNSHATYMWSRHQSDCVEVEMLKDLEAVINLIRNQGREQYKASYRQFVSTDKWVFNVIDHTDANSSFVDGFVKWKYQIEERLV